MCRRYTNITRVILTRVIFNPGQNGASVDAAYVILLAMLSAMFHIFVAEIAATLSTRPSYFDVRGTTFIDGDESTA